MKTVMTELTRIDEMRRIVKERQAHYIDGCLVDLTSAQAYLTVHQACNEKMKLALAALSLESAMKLVWRVVE